MTTEIFLRVKDVAEILRVSPMTVIRWCDSGHLPFIKIGVSRRIREADIEYILQSERGPKILKEPEKRPVYNGPPADQCGFDSYEDEVARRMKLKEECDELGIYIDAKKAKEATIVSTPTAQAPEPITNHLKRQQRKYPSGFDI